MRVLIQDKIGNTISYFKKNLSYVSETAQLQKPEEIVKALNEFKPELLILHSSIVDSVVKAYCKKNNAKLIQYGEPSNDADINIVLNDYINHPNSYPDSPKPQLEVSSFKSDCEKTDISVFINREEESGLANFLASNYNVKIYGDVKISSPKYLGMVTNQEKYEILNKSKAIVDLGSYNFHDAILLGAYPIIYTDMELPDYFTNFNNIVSLSSQMDFFNDPSNESVLASNMIALTSQCYRNNDISFVISVLNHIGLTEQAGQLTDILNNILENI